MANILILGGGFGGLIAAEKLATAFGSEHQITIVSKSRKFIFYPALVQVAFGKFKQGDVFFDLRRKLTDLGVRFSQGEVIRINAESHSVSIVKEDYTIDLSYDYLVIALGRRLATEKIPGFFEHAHHLLGTVAALKFGEAVSDFRGGTIVVGMCLGAHLPVPVCETAFALAGKFESEMRSGKVKIKVIFPESVEAAFGGADLHRELEAAFRRHGISVLYDIPILEITPEEIVSRHKHRIKYDLLMLVPPFRGNAALRNLGASDDEDFIKVDGAMRVCGLEKTYAVGDTVAFSGPKFAHMAVRQAEITAANIISEIEGRESFEEYYHEISAVVDADGADSIYLHYGIWDDTLYNLKKGRFWGWAKEMHDRFWRARHG